MAAKTPADMPGLVDERFNSGDIDQMLELYEEGAAFLPPGGEVLRGDAMRQAVGAFLATGAKLQHSEAQVIEAGDIALITSPWTLSGGTAPDGSPVEMSGVVNAVVRRQADGEWRVVIDAI